jgi:phage terminase small subunit
VTGKASAPAGLGVRGRAFWRETVADFELTRDVLAILLEVCRTLDNLDALAATISEMGTMVTGSQGQQVINPALTEARGQRQLLHRLVSAMGLPDEEGEALPSVQKIRASKAASMRWQGHRQDVARRVGMGTA